MATLPGRLWDGSTLRDASGCDSLALFGLALACAFGLACRWLCRWLWLCFVPCLCASRISWSMDTTHGFSSLTAKTWPTSGTLIRRGPVWLGAAVLDSLNLCSRMCHKSTHCASTCRCSVGNGLPGVGKRIPSKEATGDGLWGSFPYSLIPC